MKAVQLCQRILALGLLVCLALSQSSLVYSQEAADVQKSVKSYLKEKTLISGSLDLYDSNIDKVRNLKLIKLDEASVDISDVAAKIKGDFRDVRSGDIVELDFMLNNNGGEVAVDEVTVGAVKQAAAKKDDAKSDKKFTKEEAQAAMQAYIDKMSKFTGTYGLFDEKNEKLRQLELIRMDEKVRNFGILFISTLDFKDVDTGETIVADMTVQSKGGELKVKTVKIKKIIKP